MGRNIRNVTDQANLTPVGTHQSSTVSTTAVAFVVPANATHIQYTISGNPVRMRMDGTDPTSSIGLYLGVGASGMMRREAALNTKFIREGAADGQLDAQPMAY